MNIRQKHRLIYRMKLWSYIGEGVRGDGYSMAHAYADWKHTRDRMRNAGMR